VAQTFYFYDLETSGFNPRDARIMQFAGQRTDLQMNLIGEPHNILIKMTDDVVPDPDAVLITGITPQKAIADGVTEAEFLQQFHEQIATPDTIFVGYNSVRFDDEFMRYLHYRNFYDPYEWQWQDGKSRWDLLDVVRMMRALRPDGIQWPFDSAGKPSNRLELLTSVNKIEHGQAHDALSDVVALIALAKLMQQKQPKLFGYLLGMRNKASVCALAESGQPFVYSSGKYSSEWEKTTVVATIAEHPKRGVLVYDLREDPAAWAGKSATELAAAWQRRWDDPEPRLPIKTLQFNRCPAIAPLGVFDAESQKRLKLPIKVIEKHYQTLQKANLAEPVLEALAMLEKQRQVQLVVDSQEADTKLYDSFFANQDKNVMRAVRVAQATELAEYATKLKDERLQALLPLYQARNYPNSLTSEQRQQWEVFRHRRLLGGKQESRLAKFFRRLGELAEQVSMGEKRFLLEELQLYGQSILPEDTELS